MLAAYFCTCSRRLMPGNDNFTPQPSCWYTGVWHYQVNLCHPVFVELHCLDALGLTPFPSCWGLRKKYSLSAIEGRIQSPFPVYSVISSVGHLVGDEVGKIDSNKASHCRLFFKPFEDAKSLIVPSKKDMFYVLYEEGDGRERARETMPLRCLTDNLYRANARNCVQATSLRTTEDIALSVTSQLPNYRDGGNIPPSMHPSPQPIFHWRKRRL